MKKYDEGIDFVVVSYLPKGIEYCKLVTRSIHKFFDDVDYTINVVVNYTDKDKDIETHRNIFEGDTRIKILEGVNQTEAQQISPQGSLGYPNSDRIGKIDKNKTCLGSYYGCWGTNVGIKNGNRKYVCVVDADAIFLNKCSKELIDLAEKYAFIGSRWDPGNIYRTDTELGFVTLQLGFAKRKFYDDILKEKYVEKDIWTAEPWSVDYRDTGGNLTWYVKEKGLEFHILDNSHWDRQMLRDAYNIKYEDIERWNRSFSDNIIDLPYGEQAWVGNKPIFYHQTRGGLRVNNQLPIWISTCERYFDKN